MRSQVPPRRARDARARAGRCPRSVPGRLLPLAALLAVLGLAAPAVNAADGSSGVVGNVYSTETGDPLPFATITYFRTDAAATAAETIARGTIAKGDGAFRIEAEAGTYRIVARIVGYADLVVNDVEVTADRFAELDLPLTVEALQMEEVEVSAAAIRNTEAAYLIKQKHAPVVSDGISAEQIKRSADSNAADVVTRVTGMSVVGGRYVYVRGLGERYSATKVNGVTIGSPEPNKKVVPLDLFPSGLLQTISVQKTYSPDQPGEFGGGVVDISTLDFPRGRTWSFSVSGGDHSTTTGQDFATYAGGDHDYWGFSDSRRDLPDLVEELAPDEKVFLNTSIVNTGGGFDREQITAMGRAFNRVWSPTSETADPKHSYSASYGDEIGLFGHPLGFIGSFTMDHGYKQHDFEERFYETTIADSALSPRYDYSGQDSEMSTLWGGLLNTSFRVADGHTLNASAMYNRSAEDQVRTYQGQNTDTGRDARVTRLQFVERGVFVGSAGMTHVLPLFSGMTFDWKASYSQSERNEPDRREYLYEQFERTDPTTGETTETWELTRRTKDLGFTRMYTYMDDYDRGLQADLQTAFHAWNGFEAKVKIGALNKNKDRISSTRRFAYRQPLGNSGVDFSLSPEELLVDENIGASQQQFVLQELTKGTDTYEAKHDLQAGYAMVDMPLAHRVRLVTGARVEKSDFRVVTQDPFTPDAEPVVAKLEDTDVLPSANVTFAVTDEVNLRAAFSSTIARPDIRELTPFSLPEFQSGYALIGNPDLKRSLLRNYDFRAEYYPGPGELLAISGFYKDLQDPIELSLQPVAGNPAMRPVNAGEATLRGLEMEARVGLGRVTKALAPFALSTNATFVRSRAKIEDEAAAVGSGTRERPLQGQPPYVYNGGLFFQTLDGGTSASLLYNVFGRRLHAVGLRNTPDIYEEPRHSLDLTAGQRIGPVRVKASATNILDADAEFTQELDNGTTFVQHRNDTGRGLSLSLSYGG